MSRCGCNGFGERSCREALVLGFLRVLGGEGVLLGHRLRQGRRRRFRRRVF